MTKTFRVYWQAPAGLCTADVEIHRETNGCEGCFADDSKTVCNAMPDCPGIIFKEPGQ